MATEFDNALHWGLFLTGTTLTGETGKYIRVSELVLSALRAAGVFSNMVDGVVAPATDKLWLDKNVDPAVLKEWDATGASWVPMSYDRLFGRAAVDKLTVTGGTGNAVVVSQPPGFQASRLYLMTPTQNNSGAATLTVSGVGSYGVKYGNGADIGATEFTTGRQAVLFFTGVRFEVVFPLGSLSSAVLAAQAAASAAAASQSSAAGSESAAAASAALAQEFATKAEDSPITGFPALRSALHWAAKAAGYVAGNVGLAIHGFANKATLADADELVIADSANSWNGKRHSWGQLKSNIGVADNLRLGALISSSVHVDANNMIESAWYFPNGTSVANLPIAGAAGHGYIQVFQQAAAGPSSYATKQVYYEGAGHRIFERFRWYSAGAWGVWVELAGTGRQTKFIAATDWVPDLVVGPSVSVARFATNGHTIASIDFDGATTEWAYFTWAPDKKWNLSSLRFEVEWYGAAAGAGGVMFQLAAVAVGNGDAVDASIIAAQTAGGGYTGANQLQITGTSAPFTPSGPPVAGDLVLMRLGRIVADVNDTLAQDAKVLGVRVFWDAAAGNDA